MSESAAPAATTPKPKKSVALSGVVAGNTALCTVGRTGNDLHYRGYDILDIAEACEFEEIAYLLVHEKLPTPAELAAYKTKLRGLRDIPDPIREILERLPAGAHPMDVMRTAVSALGAILPERDLHDADGARDIADRLLASLGSMLLYWYHWTPSSQANRRRNRRRFDRRSFPAPAARQDSARAVGARDAYFVDPLRRARIQCVDLRRAGHRRHRLGHLFGADRRHRRAARPEARRRQRILVRGPAALLDARRGRGRHPATSRQQGSRHRLRTSGVHGQRPAQPGDQGGGAATVLRTPAT